MEVGAQGTDWTGRFARPRIYLRKKGMVILFASNLNIRPRIDKEDEQGFQMFPEKI